MVPKGPAELQSRNCIVLRQDYDAYDAWCFDELNDEIPSPKVSGDLSTNDGEIALSWVLTGHGIMLRSKWDIARHVREGRLRIVLPNYGRTAHVSAVYPDRHNLSAKVPTFIEHLYSHLKVVAKAQPLTLSTNEICPTRKTKR